MIIMTYDCGVRKCIFCNFVKYNFKINELRDTLFDLRKKYKPTNPKLATTLKYIVNTWYGNSLRKQKMEKRKYTTNIDNYINNYGNYVYMAYPVKGNNEGFVYSTKSFAPHYNYVQLGASILRNYHKFMDEIKSQVNVIYENIDAILINETDYNKLNQMGLVGDELGQFKVEYVFDRFIYKSGRKWHGFYNGESIEHRGKW